jgi:hypothetical protein
MDTQARVGGQLLQLVEEQDVVRRLVGVQQRQLRLVVRVLQHRLNDLRRRGETSP